MLRLQELDEMFRQTLEDRRLSRAERQALTALFAEVDPLTEERAAYLGRAFEAAASALAEPRDREVLEWLLAVTKTVTMAAADHCAETAEALFTPRHNCAARIRSLISESANSIDVCVFTLTDDSLSNALLEAHHRQVAVRLITDDMKSLDLGSDIDRLKEAGIEVRYDASTDHMHHKFAVFDRQVVVTGSYNWTRSASENNHENIVVIDQKVLVRAFREEFDRLWSEFTIQSGPETV